MNTYACIRWGGSRAGSLRRGDSAGARIRAGCGAGVGRLGHCLVGRYGRAGRRGAAGEVEGCGGAETLPEGIDAAAELGCGVAVDVFAFVAADAGSRDQGGSGGACNRAES